MTCPYCSYQLRHHHFQCSRLQPTAALHDCTKRGAFNEFSDQGNTIWHGNCQSQLHDTGMLSQCTQRGRLTASFITERLLTLELLQSSICSTSRIDYLKDSSKRPRTKQSKTL